MRFADTRLIVLTARMENALPRHRVAHNAAQNRFPNGNHPPFPQPPGVPAPAVHNPNNHLPAHHQPVHHLPVNHPPVNHPPVNHPPAKPPQAVNKVPHHVDYINPVNQGRHLNPPGRGIGQLQAAEAYNHARVRALAHHARLQQAEQRGREKRIIVQNQDALVIGALNTDDGAINVAFNGANGAVSVAFNGGPPILPPLQRSASAVQPPPPNPFAREPLRQDPLANLLSPPVPVRPGVNRQSWPPRPSTVIDLTGDGEIPPFRPRPENMGHAA